MFKKLIAFIAVLGFVLPSADNVFAAENVSLPFSVEPEFNSNQKKGVYSYFDLNVKAKQKQELSIVVRNHTDKPIKVYIEPTNGLTSPNGGIDYNVNKKTPGSSFLDKDYSLKSHIKVDKSVNLPANGSKKLKVIVDGLDRKGTVLGGLFFHTKGADSEDKLKESNESASFTLKKRMTFTMALVLNFSKEKIGDVEFAGAKAESTPSGPIVYMNIENNNKMIKEKIKGEYTIKNKKGDKIFGGKFGEFKMSPKTQIHYPIMWEGTFKEGKYILEVDGKEFDFTVGENVVKETLAGKKKEEIKFEDSSFTDSIWFWVIVALAVSLFFFFVLVLRRKKKELEAKIRELENHKKNM